jgi:hypothetical protein
LNTPLKKSFKKVAILNPDHLFEQAERLVQPPAAGPPRQVDVRRAISAAYYGLFHAMLIASADQFVGVTKRSTNQYALVYRSIDHGSLRKLCETAKAQSLPPKYARNTPAGGLGRNISAFAAAFLELQEKRHAADYDPIVRVKTSDAKLAISSARAALVRFQQSDDEERKAFLSLLLFPPR